MTTTKVQTVEDAIEYLLGEYTSCGGCGKLLDREYYEDFAGTMKEYAQFLIDFANGDTQIDEKELYCEDCSAGDFEEG